MNFSPLGAILLLGFVSCSTPWSNHATLRPHGRPMPSSAGRRHRSGGVAEESPLRMSLIGEVSSLYSFALTDYKLVTESATSGLLCGTADVLAQTRERVFGGGWIGRPPSDEEESSSVAQPVLQQRQGEPVDLGRCARFACKGLIGGIIWSNWYGMVDGWSSTISHDLLGQLGTWLGEMGAADDAGWTEDAAVRNAGRVATAIVLEQFVACPIIYSLWDIPVPALLNGVEPREIPGQVRSKIGPLLMSNAKVWTFVNIAVYNIPVEYRVVVMSFADLFWQSIVASVASQHANTHSENIGSVGDNEDPTDIPMEEHTFSLNPRILDKDDMDTVSAKLGR